METESIDDVCKHGMFEENLVIELMKIAMTNVTLAITLENEHQLIFQTQRLLIQSSETTKLSEIANYYFLFSCATVREKVINLKHIQSRELLDVKFNYEGCEVELFFYHHNGIDTSLLFATDYYSQHYTEMLMMKIMNSSRQHNIMDNIGFIGIFGMDKYSIVKSCIKKSLYVALEAR